MPGDVLQPACVPDARPSPKVVHPPSMTMPLNIHVQTSALRYTYTPSQLSYIMSRQTIAAHYARLLTRWPQDVLRPEKSFTKIFQPRVQTPPAPCRDEEKEVNAAYLLLDNAFTKQFRLQQRLLKPDSNPEHYTALKQELEELPHRTWFGNLKRRLTNMVRLK
ncbi:hypothetical protein CLAFUW4_13096 [Fulvia fulva]|uniref:Uncharacterized protein n=1 Tax=Passalora fulva TaxID=5499 RepID=A0A9Q8UVF5_PASFU|nr:uncharacterized protein CLAFUR5_12955 [Fulvia fulva]KAK4612003.1 hypothetical protein CLAFUR4_13100 [Fulvia fulva]KAK4613092.1 hypothetical protein CLAFUR0_13105 [Fulvia fulva]UJO23921.1 hypothetical protein CLAFUR5_12955 [Fulvia fulva]WPV21637.1 hypothetical protein CLAFUW4_13096 [Fulvia fulva]WPV36568.1 hypothetical protein CLAFUW7_13104 [Fulvia fulva]